MTSSTNTTPVSEFEFTLEEQWAIHQAFLDYVEVAEREDTPLPEPSIEIAILEKIEDSHFAFTTFELDRLRYECDHHAKSEYAPDIDRQPARAVVEKIDQRCPTARGQ